jgi:hypothetical protein
MRQQPVQGVRDGGAGNLRRDDEFIGALAQSNGTPRAYSVRARREPNLIAIQ